MGASSSTTCSPPRSSCRRNMPISSRKKRRPTWRRDPRRVGSARREQQEERPIGRRGPHEPDGPLRQPVGRVLPHEHGRPLVDRPEIAIHGLPALVPLRDESVPPAWDVGKASERVPVEVLADEPRAIAGVVQPGREGEGLVEVRAVVVVLDAGVTRVPPGQQARAGGTTDRSVRERVRERHPSASASLELTIQPRHRLERPGALVVRDHDDHVGPPVGRCLGDRPDGCGDETDQRNEHRTRHPAAACGGAHSFRTFQMCSAGNALAHSSGA